jgi:tetratricopeptide (TPR) repeat protein
MEADEGHLVEADKLMVKASELSSEDPQIWLTWGNIKRKNDRIQDALDKYEKAYKLNSEDPVILNSLGQAKCRLGDYHRADELFRAALQKRASDSSIKHEIINLSSLAENLIRWSEILINSRNYSEAEAKLKEALSLCKEVIKLDENDVKSLDLLRLVHKELGFFYKKTNDLTKASLYFGKAIVESPKRYKEAKDTMTAGLQLGNIFYSRGNVDGAKTIALKLKDIAKRFTFDSSWHQKLEYFLQRVG